MKAKTINVVKHSLLVIISGFLMLSVTFMGAIGGTSTLAIAAPISNSNLIATSASSLSKEVAGKAKQDIGIVQRNVGKASGQFEGTAKQVKGRAVRDAGRTQAKVEDTQRAVKNRARKDLNTAQNVGDRVGDRLAKTTDSIGDKAADATENTIDSIKTFFGQ